MFLLFFFLQCWAGQEKMPSMPLLQPSKVETVQGTENWDHIRGFGSQSDHVEMMNLMMVEGSGMEHMEMNMDMTAPEAPSNHSH